MAKRQSKTLTDGDLRRWIAAKTPVAKTDGDGLTFTLSANGTAAWVLRYRYGGRAREVTIGRYPDFGLAKARVEAAKLRVRVEAGDDVAASKQRARVESATALTVRQLVADFEAKVVPLLADSTAFQTMNYLRTDLVPSLGSRLARDVTDDEAAHLLTSIAESRSYWAASNLRKAAIAVFRHGRARRILKTNPFREVEMRAVAVRPEHRKRVALKGARLADFLKGLDQLPDPRDAALVELLLLTGVRIGEALSAEWVDIDFDATEWRIPQAKIKTRKRMRAEAFVIPLPPAAITLLERLRNMTGHSKWLFPAIVERSSEPRSMDQERALDRLKEFVNTLGKDFPRITFHDLRSTFRSGLTALDVRIEVAERCLNHQLGGLPGIYDVDDKYDERKLALAQWAAHLDALRLGGNVVTLQRRRDGAG